MKTYTEMAESVLKRRDEYSAKRENAVRKVKGAAACISLCCLAAAISVAALHTPKIDYPDPLVTTVGTDIGTSNGPMHWADITDWRLGDEILNETYNDALQGVYAPFYIAYRGMIFSCVGNMGNDEYYALLEDSVWFNRDYKFAAYEIKDTADTIAIIINGRFLAYQKIYGPDINMDGTRYDIVYSPNAGYTCGEIVMENEDYTVYKAVNANGEEQGNTEYIVELSGFFKREFPKMHEDDENYGHYWWLAVPEDMSRASE